MGAYICPICGYEGLNAPPKDQFGCPTYEICPCCGFEFGFDDDSEGLSYQDYRDKWLKAGAPWFSRVEPRPDNLDLVAQLKRIGVQIYPPGGNQD